MHGRGTVTSIRAPARPRTRNLQGGGPAAQGGVVRHGEIEPEQTDDGANQPFGLAQRQAEHGPERQGRQDGEFRVPGLAASGGAGLRLSGRDRFIGEPDGQTPSGRRYDIAVERPPQNRTC